jgi:hypothetical protein
MIFAITVLSFSCQSVRVGNEKYIIAHSVAELGSIGVAQSSTIKKRFSIHGFPALDNKIRLDVALYPFNKTLNKIYLKKLKNRQLPAQFEYVDSLPNKPELVSIKVLDLSGYIAEINSDANRADANYLSRTKDAKIVTGIATTLSPENLQKIREADAYYLVNEQDNKYSIALYKTDKKVGVIDLKSVDIMAYELSRCCWALNKQNKWYLSSIIDDSNSCPDYSYPTTKDDINLIKF